MIKTDDDIKKIKQASVIWKEVKNLIINNAKVGVSLEELDALARDKIVSMDAIPAFYGYQGFPKNICISVNEVLIHGVPDSYCLKDGDLVTFDVGVKYKEHFCDAAFTIIVGEKKSLQATLINDVCYNSLMKSIESIKPNLTTNYDLSCIIEDYVKNHGYEVIRNFTGHGCGNNLHEEPIISNYRSFDFEKVVLKPNMVICIEPMIMIGSNKYIISKDNGWAVYSKNKKLTCHWEHMVLITDDGYEILTE